MVNNSKVSLSSANLLVISTLLALAISEACLRFLGYGPFSPVVHPNEQLIHTPDPILGWKNREGAYFVPPYSPGEKEINYTFFSDGSRATSAQQDGSPKSDDGLIVVGGSFSRGFAISDENTFACKLQERFPFLSVVNYGTAGYGTYQSLLILEQALPNIEAPKFIVYGFFHGH